ncbi:Protein AIG2 [Glycine soja]|uniref:Protein AIG2 n=1 Tax=Glycine soja TaxID=3848 RepID=A0A0B2PRJ4_GLYSO|nr:Protein AIG2 [Glycine soja]
MKVVYFFVVLLALASSIAFAYDPSPLQDFCVAINDTKTGGLYGVLLGISGVELDILDEFKDVEYTRTDVEVSLKDKSERLQVCAYVWSNPNDPNLYAEWDFELEMSFLA